MGFVVTWNPTRVTDASGQVVGTMQGLPILASSGNEAYGAIGKGVWINRPQGHTDRVNYYNNQVSLLQDFRIWHVTFAGVYDWGQDNRYTFTGFVLRNDPAISAAGIAANLGFSFGDTYYADGQLVVSDFDVQGFNIGIQLPHRPDDYDPTTPNISRFQNGLLKNHINIEDRYARFTTEKQTYVSDVPLALVSAPAGTTIPSNPLNIWMHPDNANPHTLETSLSRLLMFNYNKQQGVNFEVFFLEQASNAVIPPYHTARGNVNPAAPGVGLTNQQAWDQYRIAIAGAVAPSVTIDSDNGQAATARGAALNIQGMIFSFIGEPPPPTPPCPPSPICPPSAIGLSTTGRARPPPILRAMETMRRSTAT
jgi:hypothetical protein